MARPHRVRAGTGVTTLSLAGVRRTLFAAVTAAVFAVLAGATYQGVATALERRRNPHPGRLVDVGGHQLHLHCVGEGPTTIVLESPAVVMSAAWGWVQQDLTSVSRVCSYDRSGLGWSEAGDGGYDPSRAVDELRVLLERAGEKRPYVLVGQEFGAALAGAFASRHRTDLAALVLIDVPIQGARQNRSSDTDLAEGWPWLARTGLLRASRLLSHRVEGLPDSSAAALSAFLNRPDHLARVADELSRWNETVQLGTSPIESGLRIERMQSGGPATASLNDPERARRVASTIASVVRTVQK